MPVMIKFARGSEILLAMGRCTVPSKLIMPSKLAIRNSALRRRLPQHSCAVMVWKRRGKEPEIRKDQRYIELRI